MQEYLIHFFDFTNEDKYILARRDVDIYKCGFIRDRIIPLRYCPKLVCLVRI